MITFVRSVGERTTDLCLSKVKNPVLIKDITPFSLALKKCFKEAIRLNEDYIICVDADVIPDEHLCDYMLSAMKKESNLYTMTVKMFDKFTNNVRTVGVHAYYVRNLHNVFLTLRECAKELRPESCIKHKMKGNGYKVLKDNIQLGLHGYEQYYKDIYRTILLWTKKHGKHEQRMLEYWESMKNKDPDFRVALKAWKDGQNMDITTCDAGIEINFDRVLAELNLEEKKSL